MGIKKPSKAKIRCKKCGKKKLLSNFYRHGRSKSGYTSVCKICSPSGRPKGETIHRIACGWDKKNQGPAKPLKHFRFKCERKKKESLSKYLPRKIIRFIESQLKFTTGKFADKPFILLPWQKQFIRDVFGSLSKAGLRKFRRVFLSMGRKGGKTEFIAAIIVFLIFTQGNFTILCAGADVKQGALIFDRVSQMIRTNAKLRSSCKIAQQMKVLTIPKENVLLKVISSESYSKHGYSADAVICDELHAWKDRSMFDVLEKSLAPAAQPLLFVTTTSGSDQHSPWKEQYEFLRKVRSGEIKDPGTYVKIFELAAEDDWKDPANWPKANPSYPVCPDKSYLEDLFLRAKHMKSAEFAFRWQNLNMWTDAGVGFVDMDIFRKGRTSDFPDEEISNRTWWGGLDLASRNDFSSFALVAPPLPAKGEGSEESIKRKFLCAVFNFLNEEKIEEYALKGIPIRQWVADGDIETNPGRTTDYDLLTEKILQIASRINIKAVAFDRKDATQVVKNLEAKGLTCIEYGQGFYDMSPPIKELGKLILDGDFLYDRNSVLEWMFSNVVCDIDGAGNLKPNKAKATFPIDAFAAIAMALGAYLRNLSLKAEGGKFQQEIREGRRVIF